MKINVLYYIAHIDHVSGDFDYSNDLNDLARIVTVSDESAYYSVLDKGNEQIHVILLDFQWKLATSILSRGPCLFTCRALDVLRTTIAKYPDSNIIIVTSPLHISELLPLYRDGVRSILSKIDMNLLEISDALFAASCGNAYIINQLSQRQRNYALAVLDPSFSQLTDEELSILEMIVNKAKTEDIRIMLNSKSIPAVRNKISKILKTIGISKRSELTALANDIGFVATDG